VLGHLRLAATVVIVLLVCLVVLVLVLTGQRERQSEGSNAQFHTLVQRARAGPLSGEQAVALAGFLGERAFAGKAGETAQASFNGAAAQLLQFTDGDVRVAAINSVAISDKKPAIDLLWKTAEAQELSAGAIYRFLGALGADDRTRVALERALASDPFDRRVWFLLSEDLQKSGEGSAFVTAMATALAADAAGRVDQTERLFTDALSKAKQPLVQAFILGRLGDGATLRRDWVAAEGYYKSATEILEKIKAYGWLTIEASRLARARQHQGKMDDACAALQGAQKAGATMLAGQTKPLCPEGG
jgi:tetratricopeptide (TPR) repeat protein